MELACVIEHSGTLETVHLLKVGDAAGLDLGDRSCGAVNDLVIARQDSAVFVAENLIHYIEQILLFALDGIGILPVVGERQRGRLAAVIGGSVAINCGDVLIGKVF